MTTQTTTLKAPPLHDWIARRWCTASGAVVAELTPGHEPFAIYERLARRRHCLFLDSATIDAGADHAELTDLSLQPRLGLPVRLVLRVIVRGQGNPMDVGGIRRPRYPRAARRARVWASPLAVLWM